MDLAVWFRDKRWVALIELIDGLPGASRFNEALLNDPEVAQDLAQVDRPDEPWTARVSEFDLTNMILATIADGVQALRSVNIAVGGGKAPEVVPFPVPRTALDRAREDLERKDLEQFLGRLGFSPGDF